MSDGLYYTAAPEGLDGEFEMVMSTDFESVCDERDAYFRKILLLSEEILSLSTRLSERDRLIDHIGKMIGKAISQNQSPVEHEDDQ